MRRATDKLLQCKARRYVSRVRAAAAKGEAVLHEVRWCNRSECVPLLDFATILLHAGLGLEAKVDHFSSLLLNVVLRSIEQYSMVGVHQKKDLVDLWTIRYQYFLDIVC